MASDLYVTLNTPPTGDLKVPTGLFINNEFVKAQSGETIETVNPSDGKKIASVQSAGEKDVDIAVAAARKAFEGDWRYKTTPEQRGKLLMKLAELFERDIEKLGAIESLDNGKTFPFAKGDVGMAAGTLRYYAGFADKIEGRVVDTDNERLNYVKHEPVGVCGQIIPWNFPLLMWSWKIGPAIATGNTVVLKAAENTPLTALMAAELVKEAGFPPGVINIINGLGRVCGSAMAAHMDIDKVAFTGSTLVGRSILKAAASSNLKKVTLELGGKSPNIIFNDADIDNALSWVHFGVLLNSGQACCAGTRIFVQDGIYDDFVAKFREKAAATKIGSPFDENVFQGAQVSQVQFDRIMSYIEEGKKAGAKVETGGERHGTEGFFIKPTIFSGVTEDMKIVQEEIFGPVCSIQKFKTEEEVIKSANHSTYGLASAVHTTNLNTAIRVSNALKAGTVWVNQYNMLHHQLPFGGYKESGIGRELGADALANYTQTKTVSIRTGDRIF